MSHDIFISYSRYDSDVVNELVTLLEQEGYSIWIDRDGIESGEDFKRVILKAIKESTMVLFFSSAHSNVSDWTAKEIGVAVKYNKYIVPIKLDDSNFNEAVEFDLINLDYVDYSNRVIQTEMREKLLRTVRNRLGQGSRALERLEAEAKRKAQHKTEANLTDPSEKLKGKTMLWVGLGIAAAVVLAVLLLKPKPKPVEESLDTQAYNACQTVQDYRRYLSDYGRNAEHYADAKRFVDDYMSDSVAKAEEQLSQQQSQQTSQGGSANGHAYVDLGLPSGTLWATCNMGASKPEGYGNYYAWGETNTKNIYNWDTYQYANGNFDKLTKYCNKSDYGNIGFTDNQTTLQSGDDPATTWGSGWRTPSKDQWDELLKNTTNKWTTQNGVKGRLFTAKNGQSLFLPAAGVRWGGILNLVGSDSYYWSSSLYTGDPGYAWYFNFSSDYYGMNGNFRFHGQSVRAVRSARQN